MSRTLSQIFLLLQIAARGAASSGFHGRIFIQKFIYKRGFKELNGDYIGLNIIIRKSLCTQN